MHINNHRDILLALAQWNKHTHVGHHLLFHPFGDRIGKGSVERKGQYHIYVSHVITFSFSFYELKFCKDSKKKADTQLGVPAFIYFNV